MEPENIQAAFDILAILADIVANRNNDENLDVLNVGILKLDQQIDGFKDHPDADKLIDECNYIKDHLTFLKECIIQNEVLNQIRFNRKIDDLFKN
jgi:hypothetical protein